MSQLSRLDLDRIEHSLQTKVLARPVGWKNELWDSIDSTNSRALELAAQGAPEGVLITARQQTAGRGRLGRTWFSPPETGIYLSLILKPSKSFNNISLMTLASGVAACQAAYEYLGVRLALKWVNDIVYEGKKVGGILAEMTGSAPPNRLRENNDLQRSRSLIVGIGLNTSLPLNDAPQSIRATVHSLDQIAGAPIDMNALISNIINHLEQIYFKLANGDEEYILTEWKKWSITLGKEIQTNLGTKCIQGTATDITSQGALIVTTDSGEEVVLHAGDITLRKADGSYC